MFPRIGKFADRLIGLSVFFGIAGLLIAVTVTLIDVVGRYFNAPLRGAQDISQMAMVIIVFGGMAICDRVGGHIAVDLLEKSFPTWLNRACDVFSALLGAAIFLGIAWTVWESAALSRMLNLATNIIYLPKAWFQYAVVAMSLVTALGMLLRAVSISANRPLPPMDIQAGRQ